ncbi:hypothetical protein ACERII_00990 [Evansella sp. AB-rgal1]|uniref:hypothetical protein n=1 Tax=Evansella sp. AB-rgal1 TaxID=3242696 RepID=UPI00359DC36A
MNKWVTSAALIAATGSYLLQNEGRRKKLVQYMYRMKAKIKNETKEEYEEYFDEKLAHTDPYDIEDNSMVGEGAVQSIQYYNQRRATK